MSYPERPEEEKLRVESKATEAAEIDIAGREDWRESIPPQEHGVRLRTGCALPGASSLGCLAVLLIIGWLIARSAATPGGGIMAVAGWAVWVSVAFWTLLLLLLGIFTGALNGAATPRLMRNPFLLAALVNAAALVLTAATPISKLHLVWASPVLFLLAFSAAARALGGSGGRVSGRVVMGRSETRGETRDQIPGDGEGGG